MSDTIRIRTTPNGSDKYLKVKLDQKFDFVEILSLKISQEDAYRKFCSDYGTIVGRVSVNSGFGVENAKVSVFIPLDDIDKNNPLIKGLYPYEVITDKDSDGIRYNLLPKISETDNECYTPIGTFPSKREVLDNPTLLEVYCKYYKFTTTTNYAGDFMIFGVPLGTYTVHVDADISDIGIASQRPYDMISQGTPAKLFESSTKFKGGTNLNKLIQVKTLNAGVNVQPFWGDPENCVIGITRLDFDLNTTIVPAAIFMGSIYGDQHKHSINKHCRPRRKLGLMCDQVTGPGSVDMIRKTFDGNIEEFSVEGGRVIDDDGTWAFQVPMNLDYMVTAEDGSLILSQDPNKGIPTRARVRFNIGMDETGGEGRLRTRARYLVPNNPRANGGISDYTFGTDTKEESFKDLYWNKIYSVSNFISRFQKAFNIPTDVSTRAFTGMKDVDACAGDKSPYPFNKVATELNPIFFIICIIIKIIGFLVWTINAILVPVINFIVDVVRAIIDAVNSITSVINDIIGSISDFFGGSGPSIPSLSYPNYMGCVTLGCPEDPVNYYAPGCESGTPGFDNADHHIDYAKNVPSGNTDLLAGFDNCMAFEMAKSLNLFKFDFYNDWINGTLFGFLLKYKKKRKKREVFCEYECDGSGTFTPVDGIDGNNNGVGDNSCQDNLLLDTCYIGSSSGNNQKNGNDSGTIRDGLIKKVGDEFFYAATTHDLSWNLFATDIICLGSVFDCDWQGIPHIQPLLISTTYKVPPDEQEINTSGQVEVAGMVNLDAGSGSCGTFFEINCIGLHVNDTQALNIRHICEMGVDINEAIIDPFTGAYISPPDCIIGGGVDREIDDSGGKWFRDVFTVLNSAYTSSNSFNIGSGGLSTSFNIYNNGVYDFASASDNGLDYTNFRGYPTSTSYAQPAHSYFFYFGILPGKTALDKMNERFFNKCNQVIKNDIIIQTQTTVASGATGSFTFTFLGGTGFSYSITGVLAGGGSYGPITGTASSNPATGTLTGLLAGTYTISATDSLGTPVTATVVVTGQPALYAVVQKTKNSSTTISNDGEITILSVGGGQPPYAYNLYSFAGVLLSTGALTAPTILSNLAVDNLIGYKVEVIDSASTTLTFTGITVGGPNPLVINASSTNNSCYGSNDGTITVTTAGGVVPITLTTTATNGYTNTSTNAASLVGLAAGTYTISAADSGGGTVSTPLVITQPPKLFIKPYVLSEVQIQCDPYAYHVPFYISNTSPAAFATGPFTYEYKIDGGSWNTITDTYINEATPIVIPSINPIINTNLFIKFSTGGCTSNILTIPAAAITRPTVALALTNLTVPYQCVPGIANVTLNITRDPARGPITVEYSKNGTNWFPAGAPTSATLGFTYTVTGLVAGGGTSTTHNLLFRATDIKGCVTTPITVPVTLPNTPLTAIISTVYNPPVLFPPSAGYYAHTVSATGGIGPYSATPYGIGTHNNINATITTTVTDSIGCSDTTTG